MKAHETTRITALIKGSARIPFIEVPTRHLYFLLLDFPEQIPPRYGTMPEQRGKQATPEVKAEWSKAYEIYLRAPGDRFDKKNDRTKRIDHVAEVMKLTRKQAKRRVRNYEAWQRNIKKGLVVP